MKIDVIIIPKYPAETQEEYEARKREMVAPLRAAPPHKPPMAYVTHRPTADLSAVPPAVKVAL